MCSRALGEVTGGACVMTAVEAGRPGGRSCILIVCNQAYLSRAACVAWQAQRHSGPDCDIVLASADPLDPPAPLRCSTMQIDPHAFTRGLPIDPRLDVFTYWKLPAIAKLAEDYDRILYFDTDLYIRRGALGDLLRLDMQGATLAAVRDICLRRNPRRIPHEFRALNCRDSPYFNAGVLLIDAQKWRRTISLDHVAQIARDHHALLYLHDQTVLNILFRNDWLELSPVWNWQYRPSRARLVPVADPCILHFSGAQKLWGPRLPLAAAFQANYQSARKELLGASPEIGPSPRALMVRGWLPALWHLPAIHHDKRRFPRDFSTHRHHPRHHKGPAAPPESAPATLT